jgi:DNA-binding MarR family transcriptional regulator
VDTTRVQQGQPRRDAPEALLRALGIELAVFNRRIVARLDISDTDLDCLNLIRVHGPLSPSGLARRAGLHPATMTGVLGRLERGGWVTRERDSTDRRSVTVQVRPDRDDELAALLVGVEAALRDVRAHYTSEELSTVADFLRRSISAVRDAANELAED